MKRIQMEIALQIGGDDWWIDRFELFAGIHLSNNKTLTINVDGTIRLSDKSYRNLYKRDIVTLKIAQKAYIKYLKLKNFA